MNEQPITVGAKLADFWQAAGIDDPQYPCETSDVLRLLDASGYRVSGDDLLSWCAAGALLVPMVGGRRKWDAEHVWAALAQCEGRRRWKPFDARHQFKASAAERMLWEADVAGAEKPIADLDRFDVEALLLLMEDAEQRHVRHVLRLAVQQKIREGGL